jgi:DNA-binding HxlR family transcriptional regulator
MAKVVGIGIGETMDIETACDPTYGRVDELMEILTRSKALHIMLVLDKKGAPLRFTDLKRLVDSTSTTVSRRLRELQEYGLIQQSDEGDDSGAYALTEQSRTLSPIFHDLFNWVANRPQ